MLRAPLMEMPAEPPQALNLTQFRAALIFHGFVMEVGMLDLVFVDRRLRARCTGATVRKTAPDGRIFIDRLATLEALLAHRRTICARRRARHDFWRRRASALMALLVG